MRICLCLQVSDHSECSPPVPAPTAGIVGALMEVMQKRSKAIHSSGDFMFLLPGGRRTAGLNQVYGIDPPHTVINVIIIRMV